MTRATASLGSRRSVQIKALLSLGMLAGLGAVSTLAAWTGTATATAPISAATVSIGVGATAAGAGTTYTVPINGANWYPGMSQAAVVVVRNSSSITLPYSVLGTLVDTATVPAGASLGTALNVSVVPGAAVVGASPNATCGSGTAVLSKAPGNAFGATPVVRPSLAPQATETLCVQYSLPANAANTLQGRSTTINLTFTNSVGS